MTAPTPPVDIVLDRLTSALAEATEVLATAARTITPIVEEASRRIRTLIEAAGGKVGDPTLSEKREGRRIAQALRTGMDWDPSRDGHYFEEQPGGYYLCLLCRHLYGEMSDGACPGPALDPAADPARTVGA